MHGLYMCRPEHIAANIFYYSIFPEAGSDLIRGGGGGGGAFRMYFILGMCRGRDPPF